MTKARLELPPKLIPVFMGEARYRGAYGGRGSGKTRSFAKMSAVKALQFAQSGQSGVILCGREYQNSLDESSLAEVKQAITDEPWLADRFDVGEKYIRTKCNRVSYVFAGLRHNLDSIKSKSRILLCWIDEAEPVSEEAWRKLIPTVREVGSEIWVTWNPERKGSATDNRFRINPPSSAKIVEINYKDNPWFTDELEAERLDDKEKRPDYYSHVWEGGYLEVKESAYFTKQIIKAKESGRWLIELEENPRFVVKLFADIGGTGARSDNFVFWASQFVNAQINNINHYEVQGQDVGAHLDWLRKEGYTKDRAEIILPHDGETNDRVIDVSYRSAFEDVGYKVTCIPNQGKGAAKQRIESIRNTFHMMHFSKKCEAGCSALAWYHEKVDEHRQVGLGPNHDWASHSADSLGLESICYEPPKPKGKGRGKNKARVNTA